LHFAIQITVRYTWGKKKLFKEFKVTGIRHLNTKRLNAQLGCFVFCSFFCLVDVITYSTLKESVTQCIMCTVSLLYLTLYLYRLFSSSRQNT